ncbi:hypothetical protein [Pyruvatibacter mobilis]|uniref:hypothetical protein n=1 Tax=Pyruvatibacter mobilis TaxID=1712261 RepID=UPI003D0E0DFB
MGACTTTGPDSNTGVFLQRQNADKSSVGPDAESSKLAVQLNELQDKLRKNSTKGDTAYQLALGRKVQVDAACKVYFNQLYKLYQDRQRQRNALSTFFNTSIAALGIAEAAAKEIAFVALGSQSTTSYLDRQDEILLLSPNPPRAYALVRSEFLRFVTANPLAAVSNYGEAMAWSAGYARLCTPEGIHLAIENALRDRTGEIIEKAGGGNSRLLVQSILADTFEGSQLPSPTYEQAAVLYWLVALYEEPSGSPSFESLDSNQKKKLQKSALEGALNQLGAKKLVDFSGDKPVVSVKSEGFKNIENAKLIEAQLAALGRLSSEFVEYARSLRTRFIEARFEQDAENDAAADNEGNADKNKLNQIKKPIGDKVPTPKVELGTGSGMQLMGVGVPQAGDNDI